MSLSQMNSALGVVLGLVVAAPYRCGDLLGEHAAKQAVARLTPSTSAGCAIGSSVPA